MSIATSKSASNQTRSPLWESPQWREAVRENPSLSPFFDNLESFVELPKGIEKLREMFLQLALRGKLVEQKTTDAPAATILASTATLFSKLVAEKKLKRPLKLEPISDDEKPFPLPRGWEWCRFGQLLRISSGDGLTAKNMIEGTIPVYGGNGVTGHHNESNVERQTLVIGRVGFYCGSCHITPERAWVTDNAFITIFDENNLNIEFLNWLLRATDLRERDNATAQPVISGRKVYPVVLPLPPLAEQRRIVSKVEGLMSLCDTLESQRRARMSVRGRASRSVLSRLTASPAAIPSQK